jgi:hypothetical protein
LPAWQARLASYTVAELSRAAAATIILRILRELRLENGFQLGGETSKETYKRAANKARTLAETDLGPMSCILSKIWPKEKGFAFPAFLSTVFLLFDASGFAQQRDNAANLARWHGFLQQRDRSSPFPDTTLPPLEDVNDSRTINSSSSYAGRTAWKINITTTVFWVGEEATVNNPVANDKSAWDGVWRSSYGGYDNPRPAARVNFVPTNFQPRQNPFYVALPYNDVDNHHTKPEAAQVIPWFRRSFVRDGQSVCKGRWVAIRHGNRVCYAQWEDVGPFATDHWRYVFGNERPRPNRNHDAGLDVSPAVRDYLGLGGLDVCDWKFVDFLLVPSGPWAKYGDNNTFVRLRRRGVTSIASQSVRKSAANIPH